MPIVIHSPYSGKPVKVRDEDVGRAIRDEEGRIFYVVERSNGQGYYAAQTRQGGQRDEQRYDRMMAKTVQSKAQVRQEHEAMHDATGKRRPGLGRLVFWLIIIAALAFGGWWAYQNGYFTLPSAPVSSPETGMRLPVQSHLL